MHYLHGRRLASSQSGSERLGPRQPGQLAWVFAALQFGNRPRQNTWHAPDRWNELAQELNSG